MFIDNLKASWLIILTGNKPRKKFTKNVCVLSKLLHQVVSVFKINIEKNSRSVFLLY